MANTYIAVGQGRVWIAPRGDAGVNGALVELGDTENMQFTSSQQFLDYRESQTGNRLQVIHANTQTDFAVSLDVKSIDAANLVRAFYGSTSTAAGATVVDEAHVAYKGGMISLVGAGVSAVTVKKGAATLVLGTDYTVNATHGHIQFLAGSTAVTAADGSAGDNVLVSYTHTGETRVEAATAGQKNYKIVFEQIDNKGKVRRYEIHNVALEMSKTFDLIMTGVNTLKLAGAALPADEISTGSQVYTVVLK